MQKYRHTAATPIRVTYGIELVAGLRAFPETSGLAGDFEALNDRLDAAGEATRAAEKPLGKHRAELRVAELGFERLVRTFARAVEVADGGRRGPLYEALLPGGLTALLAPAGTRQVPPARDFVAGLRRSLLAPAEALRGEWLPRLEAAVERLTQAVDAYGAARAAALEAFQAELVLRDEHELAVDRLAGQVRAAFPRDRVLQDAIFPPLARGAGGASAAAPVDEPESP